MWRYIAGVKRTAEESVKEKGEPSEVKAKKRFFNEKWRTAESGERRSWLVYEEESQMMYCSVCRKHASDTQKSNSFIAGTKNLKLEAVKDHELSKCHIHVLKIAKGKSAPEDSPAMKTLNSLKTAQLERLALLFRNAHAIAKKGRPFNDFEWQCT